jgi:hypothetical protein
MKITTRFLLSLIAVPVRDLIFAELDKVTADTVEGWKQKAKAAISRALGL